MGEVTESIKRRLSVYEGSTNSISNEELYTVILKTLNDIIAVLSDHCGPGCKNATIIEEKGLNTANPVVSTKDGIMILDTLDYVSPIQTYIKNFISYIGKRVDNVAHDGTTSSMLIVSMVLRLYFESKVQKRYYDKDNLLDDINRLMDNIDGIKETLGGYVITVDRVKELLGGSYSEKDITEALVYAQAMNSSKGNIDLSKKIAKIYSVMPKEMYGYFTYNRSPIETNWLFKVDTPEYQWSEDVIPYNNTYMNHNFGEELKYDRCNLLVIPEMVSQDHPLVGELYRLARIKTEPMVILVGDMSPDVVVDILDTTNEITIFKYVNHAMRGLPSIALQGMNAAAGVKPHPNEYINRDSCNINGIIKDVKIHFNGRQLAIDGLYKCSEDTVHEWYQYVNDEGNEDENISTYVGALKSIMKYIKKNRDAHDSNANQRITGYITLLLHMVNGKLPILTVGGNTYQNYENSTVVQDTLGAVDSGLTHGWLVDGNLKLTYATKSKVMNEVYTELSMIIENKRNACLAINDTDVRRDYLTYKSTQYIPKKTKKVGSIELMYSDKKIKRATAGYVDSTSIQKLIDGKVVPFLIQPVDIYYEILDRLKEVGPMLMNSSRMIVPGTANIKEEK